MSVEVIEKMDTARYSLVIPVYKNEDSLPDLLVAMVDLSQKLGNRLEVVFVVHGSPDNCHAILKERLPEQPFPSKLLSLSRNFGSFAAIRAGLSAASGSFFAVMAADLQEPPDLAQSFFETLERDDVDVVVGTREGRDDPLFSRLASGIFWGCYRRFVHPEIPPGGIDVFGCNDKFRLEILRLEESNTSLVGLICWLGFRRETISYRRLQRQHGVSAWTFRRRFKYLLDSIFSFTDLPIRILTIAGVVGFLASLGLSVVVFTARMLNLISILGYTPIILVVTLLGSLNLICFGIIGSYVWRTFENTKRRPEYLVMESIEFDR